MKLTNKLSKMLQTDVNKNLVEKNYLWKFIHYQILSKIQILLKCLFNRDKLTHVLSLKILLFIIQFKTLFIINTIPPYLLTKLFQHNNVYYKLYFTIKILIINIISLEKILTILFHCNNMFKNTISL